MKDETYNELDQIIDEAEELPLEYLTGAYVLHDDREFILPTDSAVEIFTAMELGVVTLSDTAQNVVNALGEITGGDFEMNPIYDEEAFKKDVVKFVDDLIAKHFPKKVS